MINHRLTWFLQDNNLITKYQCGFQKGKSTTDHLVRLETYIRQGFVKNQHTVGIFFDLEKAYDTTWESSIMKDLHEMGLKGRLPLFINNFLKGRKFEVRLDNTHSSLNPQEEGVPQGSILSPTLFTGKINSIIDALPEGIEMSLYVDDLAVYCEVQQYGNDRAAPALCLDKLVTQVRIRTALNFLIQKLYVYIFVTKMAYSPSLFSNYMYNSFLLKSRSNFLVFSSTGSSVSFHISNI